MNHEKKTKIAIHYYLEIKIIYLLYFMNIIIILILKNK